MFLNEGLPIGSKKNWRIKNRIYRLKIHNFGPFFSFVNKHLNICYTIDEFNSSFTWTSIFFFQINYTLLVFSSQTPNSNDNLFFHVAAMAHVSFNMAFVRKLKKKKKSKVRILWAKPKRPKLMYLELGDNNPKKRK